MRNSLAQSRAALAVLVCFVVLVVTLNVPALLYAEPQTVEEKAALGSSNRPYADWLEFRAKQFENSATKFPQVTDKVTTHKYQYAYGFMVQHLRDRPVKMLEIGLGCGMPYGPGGSIPVWKDFFGNQLTLHMMEYDGQCAEPFHSKVDKLFVGDQEDRETLKRIVQEGGGNYDFITDDGGHMVSQQITSFQELWAALKPGGVYVIEDLQTSYLAPYGGGFRRPGTAIEYIKSQIDTFYGETPRSAYNPEDQFLFEIHSMHCWHELCAFVKKWK